MKFEKTVDYVDIQKFMGPWYVLAGRTTFLEAGAHNSIEIYTWNAAEDRIDIDFKFRKDSFDGKLKSIPQKAWIKNKSTNAHWKVSPFWPLKFDYLVIALDQKNYEWTAIGVPDGSKLWIMARKPNVTEEKLASMIKEVGSVGYPIEKIERVPQKW